MTIVFFILFSYFIFQNLRVRCCGGVEFFARSAQKVHGSLNQKFLLTDGDRAISGSYRWAFTLLILICMFLLNKTYRLKMIVARTFTQQFLSVLFIFLFWVFCLKLSGVMGSFGLCESTTHIQLSRKCLTETATSWWTKSSIEQLIQSSVCGGEWRMCYTVSVEGL